MNDHYWLSGEIHAGICLGDCRVIPRRDLSEEDSGKYFGRELDLLFHARNVVGGDDRTEYGWNVKNLYLRLAELFIRHWAVTGAELNSLREHLADTAAATDGLVVDLNITMLLVVFAEPLGIHRIRKSSACGVDICLRGSERYEHRYTEN